MRHTLICKRGEGYSVKVVENGLDEEEFFDSIKDTDIVDLFDDSIWIKSFDDIWFADKDGYIWSDGSFFCDSEDFYFYECNDWHLFYADHMWKLV